MNSSKMKAVVITKYGSPDVFQVKEVEKPAPQNNEILVEVHAASVNKADWYIMKGEPFLVRIMDGGILKPKNEILGSDIAGRVEAVGRNVKQFEPGDEVFGNLSGHVQGVFAEYVCAPENTLSLKPRNISFEEAAAVPLAAMTALQGIRDKGQIKVGEKVLINGASGGVGTFAVQIAKSLGAEVTAVTSTKKLGMARSIGADQVIDYTQEDFTKKEKHYDLIIAANGYHPIFDYMRVLSPRGRYVMIGGTLSQMFQAILLGPLISRIGRKKIGTVSLRPNQGDLVFLKELIETGQVKPVIDRNYTLSEVPDAFRYLEEWHASGKIVIKVEHD
jgi:NADPH:quinone reductase-like Zn-dependent oxidoreductase